MGKYILAVPNFSDGKRTEVIEAIVDQVRNVKGVKLLDYHPDPDFNRTVVTLIGRPQELKEALLNLAGKAIQLINMEEQSGSHPRIGAQDTIPIFPLKGISLAECIELAEEIGSEVYQRFDVPVYFSGENSRKLERRSLDFIRKGQFEGLKLVAHTEERKPDLGPASLHTTAGAVIVSAGTRPLVAFNVILDTNNLEIAKQIALMMRGPSGGFTTVRSVGLKFENRNQVCVSMNMFDTDRTPLYRTYELIKLEASRYGINVVGSEIVGVVPMESLVNSLEFFLRLERFDRNQILENHLIDLDAEDTSEKALESTFLEKLASPDPAPGGGSAAAYMGAMAAALVAMVARLTIGKEKYADVESRMIDIASQADSLRCWFQEAVILDEQAFRSLMKAKKLPRGNDVEQEARNKAIAIAIKNAVSIPLQVVEKALIVIHLATEVVEFGNSNAITDAGSAALIAHTAIKSAGLNVKINAATALDKSASEEWVQAYGIQSNEADLVFDQIQATLKTRSAIQI
ncbi:MAG: glutamate formimidoyltransferase [Anaerolineaceae bacterium]|nr:glutamate formimidoyltransferase [Anaerolineaceae bacterium]